MNIEQLEEIPFPKEFEGSIHPKVLDGFLCESLANSKVIRDIVKVTDALYMELDQPTFIFKYEYIGGPLDGEIHTKLHSIRTEDDLKVWMFWLAFAGMLGVERFGAGGISYRKAWAKFKFFYHNQKMAMLSSSSGEFVTPLKYVTHQSFCIRCNKSGPVFWTQFDHFEWIRKSEWLESVCKKCWTIYFNKDLS
jgi:hypothetical protein